ncbi:alpha/beta hydrolase [Mycolicibacterium goodii]|uniref:alpha/beta hydrolase n=1 Tax=Mycolicibacterium goodii TaxID=134601 RepID=UPI0006735A38
MVVVPLDPQDISAARTLRTEFARFWSTEKGDPRAVYDRFIGGTPVAEGVSVEHVDGDQGAGVWVRPGDAAPERVLLFLHGGGYGLGSPSAYTGLVSQLAVRTGAGVFVLDYPLAPEARLPAALDDAVATLRHMTTAYECVAVAGDSAGGGLALALTQQARAQNLGVAATAVFSPWTDLSLGGDSMQTNAAADPLLDPDYLLSSARAYLGSAAPRDPRASPLFGAMEGLPPVLIQVGSDEILLDDSRRFAASTERAGGIVELQEWQGMHHVFQLDVAHLRSARAALDHAARFLHRHLNTGQDVRPTIGATDQSLLRHPGA